MPLARGSAACGYTTILALFWAAGMPITASIPKSYQVWKREQKAAAEQKKLEELRQQYEDERKNQEIIQIAQDAGHGKKGDRLDWMYAGSLAAKEDAAKRQEEALLGQRAATLTGATQPMEISRAEVASALPTVHAVALPASQNEEWNRLNNDPLLLIKRQQHEQLKRIKENPIKMQEILKEVQQERLKHKEKKSKKHKVEESHISTATSQLLSPLLCCELGLAEL
ncbi:Cir_N domain-containing protein [Haematococcus lacustris]|uniref:Cir_N domain-containing protein n=1 Tax=Haematococcus lacustris TaxID=44745 RepID=A0A699ZJE1_HAELA|nr:Cir_N domain-containing protein [Haematococcus lacustris]